MPSPTNDPSALPVGVQALRENEQLFRLLVNSVKDYSIYVLDMDGRIVTWNPGAQRIKGYTAEEIIGKPYEIFFSDSDRAADKPSMILSHAARHGSFHDEGWRVRKDGTTFWASATLTALHDESGQLRGFAKVTHDDTTKHNTAESLRRSEERFRLAIAALREYAFYMLDVEGNVQSWNAGAERNKGYTAKEIIGQHFSLFFTDDDRVSGKPMRELAVARQMGSFEEEGWRVRKDGSRFWAAVVITAILDASGALHGFVKVTRDETAKHEASMQLQKALERARIAEMATRQHANELEKRVAERTELLTQQTEKLGRTNAELEQFAFIASHDLKEPLRMITSYLDLLRERYGSQFDERAGSYFSRVISAADRMRELVEAVLEYSRSEEGFAAVEVVPIAEVVQTAISNQALLIQQVGGQVAVEALPVIRANRLHLVRVFQNLIANAIKFRSDRPLQVRISSEQIGDEWIVTVADNGIGIDERMRPRLFKIFQRLHATDEYPGTGIGLATCKKIIEHHRGRIWVEASPDQGSTFRMSFPRES